jgi:hypothetical protein
VEVIQVKRVSGEIMEKIYMGKNLGGAGNNFRWQFENANF